MSRNCIEFGSSNTQKKGVSLFGLPNDAKMKRAWTLEVHRTRKEHFSEDCLNPHQSPPNKDETNAKPSISSLRKIILYKPPELTTLLHWDSLPCITTRTAFIRSMAGED